MLLLSFGVSGGRNISTNFNMEVTFLTFMFLLCAVDMGFYRVSIEFYMCLSRPISASGDDHLAVEIDGGCMQVCIDAGGQVKCCTFATGGFGPPGNMFMRCAGFYRLSIGFYISFLSRPSAVRGAGHWAVNFDCGYIDMCMCFGGKAAAKAPPVTAQAVEASTPISSGHKGPLSSLAPSSAALHCHVLWPLTGYAVCSKSNSVFLLVVAQVYLGTILLGGFRLFDHVLDNVFLLCLECRPDIVLDRFWCRGKFFSSDAFFRDRAVLGRGVTSSRCYILYTAAARRAPLTHLKCPEWLLSLSLCIVAVKSAAALPLKRSPQRANRQWLSTGFRPWRVCVFIDWSNDCWQKFFSLQGKKDTVSLLSLAAWARP